MSDYDELNRSFTRLNTSVAADPSRTAVVNALLKSVKKLVGTRSSRKKQITLVLKSLTDDMPLEILSTQIDKITTKQQDIQLLDNEIAHLYETCELPELVEKMKDEELERMETYHFLLANQLHSFKLKLKEQKPQSASASGIVQVIQPKVNLPNFYGDKDVLKYASFMRQYKDSIYNVNHYSKIDKLILLKSLLRVPALNIIDHLENAGENLDTALKFLDSEYKDESQIIDRHFEKILNLSAPKGNDFAAMKKYFGDARVSIYELRNMKLDALENGTLGSKIISYILMNKSPTIFKRRLQQIILTDHPETSQIIDNYAEVIRSLEKTSNSKSESEKSSSDKPKVFKNQKFGQANPGFPGTKSKPSLQNFSTNTAENKLPDSVQAPKPCKLCNAPPGEDGKPPHNLTNCTAYPTADARIRRFKELKLCHLCTAAHDVVRCAGAQNRLRFACRLCNSKSHITAVCTNIPINNSTAGQGASVQNRRCLINYYNSDNVSTVLLPSMTVDLMYKGHKFCSLRAQLDLCSTSSYISAGLKNNLTEELLETRTFQVKTFAGVVVKTYPMIECDVFFSPSRHTKVDFIVDKDFDLDYEVGGLKMYIDHLKSLNYKFADANFNNQTSDDFSGFTIMFGCVALQALCPLRTIRITNGMAYEVSQGIILYGDVKKFNNVQNNNHIIQTLNMRDSNDCTNSDLFSSADSFDSDIRRIDFNTPKLRTLSAISNDITELPRQSVFHEICEEINPIEQMVQLESIGISSKEDLSLEDKHYMSIIENSIQFKDGKYQVAVPFMPLVNKVPSNWRLSLATMDRVYKKLDREGLLDEYTNIFHNQLESGIISEINVRNYDDHIFLPHFPVFRSQSATTRIRPVYNASSKPFPNLPTLNQATYQGVDKLESLTTLLLKFRQNSYVLIADIARAYHCIFLAEDCKNKFCFFWRENGNLKAYRFNTFIFGLNVAGCVLMTVIKHHLSKYPKLSFLSSYFYCDNLIYTSSRTLELENIYKEVTNAMADANFNLREFITNNNSLIKTITNDKKLSKNPDFQKVLGYQYSQVDDSIQLAQFDTFGNATTKREIASAHGTIFDPLSLFVPVTITGRIILCEINERGYDWDDPIDHPDLQSQWNKYKTNIEQVKYIKIPRMTIDLYNNKSLNLYNFCDGSAKAYGFCSYISQLVFAKSKVKMKGKTIPQIELLSYLLTLKCLPNILESYEPNDIKSIHIFSDSQVTLGWAISGSKTKNKFTKNRIKDVQSMKSELEEKHKVPVLLHYSETKSNPADLLTRGITTLEFQKNLEFWLHGPSFLQSSPNDWPKFDLKCLSEESQNIVNVNFNTRVEVAPTPSIIEFERFSNLKKLEKATLYVFKFVNRLKQLDVMDSSKWLNLARTFLLKEMQRTSYQNELEYLKRSNKTELRMPLLVRNLNLYLDNEGLIRCKGRLGKSNTLTYNVMNPILLSKTHPLTKLKVEWQHFKCCHMGVATTLSQIRESGYWIPSGRQVVKSIIGPCITCKKIQAFSLDLPKLTNLPKERLSLIIPFKHTALDYTGFLTVYEEDSSSTKMYIVLYTCLALRCIHLDVVPDMTVKSFLQSFRRFCNSYTIPDSLYTDNARQLLATRPYLQQVLVSDECQEFLTEHSIQHKTIPSYASHAGGIFERCIQTIKRSLYKTVWRSKLSYFDLITVLSDIQLMVNNRPITYMYSDINEIEALTPNKILKLHSNSRLVLIEDEKDSTWKPDEERNPTHEDLNNTLKKHNELFAKYQKIWHSDYLLSIRESSKDVFQEDYENRMAVGDIVLVFVPNRNRVFWQMAKVLQLLPDEEGRVRSAIMRFPGGRTARHSVKHIYPLEIRTSHLGERNEPLPNLASSVTTSGGAGSFICSSDPTSSEQIPTAALDIRPRRKAAEASRALTKKQLDEGHL